MAKEKKRISSVKKAAIVIASLDKDKAVAVLRSFSPVNVKRISAEIGSLGEITSELQDLAFSELADRINNGCSLTGGEDLARALLKDVVGHSL